MSRRFAMSREYYLRLGTHITLVRQIRNMTQASCAKALGISRTQYTNMELGRSRVAVDQLTRLAAHLRVKPAMLLRAVAS